MKKLINVEVGQRFGRLTVVKNIIPRERHPMVLCRCDCGNRKEIRLYQLYPGKTKSCGCYQIDRVRHYIVKHDLAKTPFYNVWKMMKARCLNSNNKHFKDYGGRGIIIDLKWLNFINFRDDMYDSYLSHVRDFSRKETFLDRKDNDGNYCFANCKWSTRKEQNRNSRNNRFVTYNGKKKTVSEWAELLGLNYMALYHRLIRGWSLQRALTKKEEKDAGTKQDVSSTEGNAGSSNETQDI